jgi:hypothetical protein
MSLAVAPLATGLLTHILIAQNNQHSVCMLLYVCFMACRQLRACPQSTCSACRPSGQQALQSMARALHWVCPGVLLLTAP